MRAKPKANAMPTCPTLSPATKAVPQPKSTRMNVPTASAKYLFIVSSLTLVESQVIRRPCAAPEAIRAGIGAEAKTSSGAEFARSLADRNWPGQPEVVLAWPINFAVSAGISRFPQLPGIRPSHTPAKITSMHLNSEGLVSHMEPMEVQE